MDGAGDGGPYFKGGAKAKPSAPLFDSSPIESKPFAGAAHEQTQDKTQGVLQGRRRAGLDFPPDPPAGLVIQVVQFVELDEIPDFGEQVGPDIDDFILVIGQAEERGQYFFRDIDDFYFKNRPRSAGRPFSPQAGLSQASIQSRAGFLGRETDHHQGVLRRLAKALISSRRPAASSWPKRISSWARSKSDQ